MDDQFIPEDNKETKTIVLVGNSPAIFVCAIYLFTANIKPVVVLKKVDWNYTNNFFPGINCNRNEIDLKCYEQAKNMGIEIVEPENVSILESNDKFIIKNDDDSLTADILVCDVDFGLNMSQNIFIVKDRIKDLVQEAIVVAGEGCKIAFDIKEILMG